MNTPIARSMGGTESERYLAALADRTFLNLWSYANLFIDKRSSPTAEGKELCDLLVVCGDHVLVFSEKTIAFQDDKEAPVAWQRWYRAAVLDSVKQVNGAIRWIKEFPNRIFLDRACTVSFPIAMPSLDTAKFHGIVVARGSKDACKKHFNGGMGSLALKSGAGDVFCIGEVNEGKNFIHVLDDVTLDIVLSELDTISDMTRYLDKKEKLIRADHLFLADGEEALLAYYLFNFAPETNERDFFAPGGKPCQPGEKLRIEPGTYGKLNALPEFRAKKDADKISYMWDKLIKRFTDAMLKDEMAEIEQFPYRFGESELVVRHMALEDRFQRRVYAGGLKVFFGQYKKEMARMCRAMLPTPTGKAGYVFLILKRPEGDMASPEYQEKYKEYREYRRAMLTAYCMHHANQHRHVEKIIGIASEPPAHITGMPGSSEELMMLEVGNWSEEGARQAVEGAKIFDIGMPGNASVRSYVEDEIPKLDMPSVFRDPFPLNRQQRRALKARCKRR